SSKNTQTDERYVSVQDYTGEGYRMKGGEEEEVIAKKNREEIEKAVKEFFLDKYKTEVIVKNLVGSDGAVSVIVKSKGLLDFYTYAIVPINDSENKVYYEKVFSEEGEVEAAIQSGLYKITNEEAFNLLNTLLENFSEENSITGITSETVQKLSTSGYNTPYYYVTVNNDTLTPLLQAYLDNPNISRNDLLKIYESTELNVDGLYITIQIYMADKNKQPDKEVFRKLKKIIEENNNIPKGSYNILLHDNYINKRTAIGSKNNTIESTFNNLIVKE
uniref:DUF1672 family protein n=1 Tax=Bacillus mediterraneensis TaxID=1805474 RepID=UPI00114D455A